jgi:small subunit ribosomal protein S17
MKRTTKFSVHDPKEDAQIGDLVEIIPCRRISKNKSWRLLKVVRRGEAD